MTLRVFDLMNLTKLHELVDAQLDEIATDKVLRVPLRELTIQ